MAVKSALLGTRHPRKEKEAALQNVTGEPACLYCRILMTTQSEMEPSIKIEELKSVAHNRRGRNPESGGVAIRNPGLARPVAGCPHQKGSGLSTLPRTTYQTYLRGGGGTYIHTDTYIPRLLTTEKQAQAGSPKIRNPSVETPTNCGERVKRCPNEIRAYLDNPSFLPSFLPF